MNKKQHIDFKYNLKIYFELLKKYKLVFAIILIIVLFTEAVNVIDKFLFKIIVDKGNSFVSGTLTKEVFIHILMILAAVYIFALSLKIIFKFVEHYLINKFETNLIIDLKIKFLII